MLLSILIILPFLTGVGLTVIKHKKTLGWVGSAVSLYMFVFSLFLLFSNTPIALEVAYPWFNMGGVEAYFALDMSGLGGVMVLLTSLVYALMFLYFHTLKKEYSNFFYGLMMITMAGLNGVFLAKDLLLFYFFWEIVLIPIYYLVGIWGAKRTHIKNNTTFFIYTIFGSFIMLAGILYIGFYLRPESYLLKDVVSVTSGINNLQLLPWLFLIAFAIKIPLFPLHTWQPLVYKTAATPVTIIFSSLMAKMGLFAVITWLLNMFPIIMPGTDIILYVVGFGLVYAAAIALTSNSVKRIIAFSSISHLALIFMGLYTMSDLGTNGAYFQMFSHGIVVLGMWLCYDYMNRRHNVTTVKSVAGLAIVDPAIGIFFTFFCLANLSLPFTSSFIGEFSLLGALFSYNPILCILGCIGAILSAAYNLRVSTFILWRDREGLKNKRYRFPRILYWVFGSLAFVVVLLGVYPSIIFNLF